MSEKDIATQFLRLVAAGNIQEAYEIVVHIFRFDRNHIVEMWDLGQQVPENMPNENGMF